MEPRAAQALIAAATAAREAAWAPYSNYRVGAAVMDASGRIFSGCNVENVSYGLSLCAERSAISAAVAAGVRSLVGIVVVTEAEPPGSPCGACRQWMAEFGEHGMAVISVSTGGSRREWSLAALLPDPFRISRGEGE